ncbi:MAG: hypothetical protein IJB93_06810 [Clostridia bacterium]|nr:hypothetical protein [Clostridia bacterium]
MNEKLKLSQLGHTWLFDLDGTVLKHNGYLTDGTDTLLDGASDFLKSIPQKDSVVFITSRSSEYKQATEEFLKSKNTFDVFIYLSDELPRAHKISGKYRHIYKDFK